MAYDICPEALEDWKNRGEQGKPYQLCERLGRIDQTGHWEDLPPVVIVIMGMDLCECENIHTPDQPACHAVVFENFDHQHRIDSVIGLAQAIQAACTEGRVEIRYYEGTSVRVLSAANAPAIDWDDGSTLADDGRSSAYPTSADSSDAGWDNAY